MGPGADEREFPAVILILKNHARSRQSAGRLIRGSKVLHRRRGERERQRATLTLCSRSIATRGKQQTEVKRLFKEERPTAGSVSPPYSSLAQWYTTAAEAAASNLRICKLLGKREFVPSALMPDWKGSRNATLLWIIFGDSGFIFNNTNKNKYL